MKYRALSEGDLLFSDDGHTYVSLGFAACVGCPDCGRKDEFTHILEDVESGEYYMYFCACQVLCKIDIHTECERPRLFMHEKEE